MWSSCPSKVELHPGCGVLGVMSPGLLIFPQDSFPIGGETAVLESQGSLTGISPPLLSRPIKGTLRDPFQQLTHLAGTRLHIFTLKISSHIMEFSRMA